MRYPVGSGEGTSFRKIFRIPTMITNLSIPSSSLTEDDRSFVRFEDVSHLTTEDYFEGNQFSVDVFEKKYRIGTESYVEGIWRVCRAVASVESTAELREYWARRWFHEIYNDWWHPAGSIMQGAGNPKKISLSNCTTISLGTRDENNEWDSLEAIFRSTGYTTAKTAAYRQGLGIDFSRLRPRGAELANSAQISTGAVHWMGFVDQIGYFVGQLGRRPAMLFSLSCTHPDVEEFILAKQSFDKIQNANISVQCTDGFWDAVARDGDWVLSFEVPEIRRGDRIYVPHTAATDECSKDERGWYYVAKFDRKGEKIEKTVKARYLLELIAKGMCAYAEPGIQNIDTAKRLSNSDYVYDPEALHDSRIVSTNACSEQYLSPLSLCVLSSINCGKFSTDPNELERELSIVGPSINRFLDNVNELEIRDGRYAVLGQKHAIEALRRTGAGWTNLAAWFFRQGLEYGSPEANRAAGFFMERYNYHLYRSSIELGREKGSFGLFDREKFERSPFVRRMMELGLEFDAMRNVTVSSIAPTGTLTTQFRGLALSYGIEPPFGAYYWKRTRISGEYRYYFCVPRVVRETVEAATGKKLPIDSDTVEDTWDGKIGRKVAEEIELAMAAYGLRFRKASEVDPMDKLDLMVEVARYVDSSISTTYMLPPDSDWKRVADFLQTASSRGLKSVAAFPDRKMYGIVSGEPFRDLAERLVSEGVSIHPQNFNEKELAQLGMSAEAAPVQTEENHALPRPERLPCHIHHVSVNGEKWVVVVGIDDRTGLPYEVFGGKADKILLTKKMKSGFVRKNRGKTNTYDLEIPLPDDDELLVVKNIVKTFDNAEYADSTRYFSMMLRHRVPIRYVVEQLRKSQSDSVVSFCRVMARVFLHYQNGTAADDPSITSEDTGCVSGNCE